MDSADELAEAIAINAAKAWAGREAKRKTLTEGESHVISLTLSGTIDGRRVKLPIKGTLDTGVTNPTGYTKKPSCETLLLLALDAMPKTRVAKFFEQFKKRSKALPKPSGDHNEAIQALIGRLSNKSPRKGSVSLK